MMINGKMNCIDFPRILREQLQPAHEIFPEWIARCFHHDLQLEDKIILLSL